MSNFGQAALSIGGAAIGFVFGGGIGAAWGLQLGGLAGSALFPTDLGTVSGPRLNDLNVQSSAVGAPIPIVYGTYAIAGNVIWSSGIIETVSKKKQGGKGGPTQTVKTYTYKANCAAGICEGPIAGVIRIWADAKLIYDIRDQQEGETDAAYAARQAANATLLNNTEIYLGDSTQLADPTIESFEGVGNVSAFRDLAYVVFSEFQLADYGNRIPNFRFEVASLGIVSDECVTVSVADGGYVPEWTLGGGQDPRADGYVYDYNQSYRVNPSFNSSLAGGWTSDFGTALSALSALDGGRVYAADIYQWTPVQIATGSVDSLNGYRYPQYPCSSGVGAAAADNMYIDIFINSIAGLSSICATGGEGPVETLGSVAGSASHVVASATGTFDPGIYQIVSNGAPNTIGGIPATNLGGVNWNGSSFDDKLLGIYDNVMKMRRKLQAPLNPCAGYAESDMPGYCYRDGVYIQYDAAWVYNAGTVKGINVYTFSGAAPSTAITQRGVGPYRTPEHPDYNDQDFWEAAYATAVANAEVPAGWTYGVEYPQVAAEHWTISYEQCTFAVDGTIGAIPLGDIVQDICVRAGLSADQIDVSDLTEGVDGYVLGTVMSARDAISPLRTYGWFDCVESEGVLKWPTRGKAAVFDLTADDLAAHVAGDSRPSSVDTARQQEVELPRRLRVHYAQTAQNYEPGEQGASRLAAGDVEVRDIEVAVAMSDTKAAQIADVVLYDLWTARNRYRAIVDHAWLHLEPADAGTMPIDGRQERVRIVSIDHSLPGLLRLDLVRDDDGVYESYAIGAPAAYAGTGGGTISTPGEAELVLLDLPLLRDADNDAGYYAAIHSVGGTNWGGAILFRSPDGGTTYEQVGVAAEEATVGRLAAALDAGPTTIIDEGNELFVDLDSGELESISETSLLAGLNAAAIGADDRWEVIQFRDAVSSGSPSAWRLTGLLRGRRGTEWAVGSSESGDTFVLLDSALVRVEMNLAAIGAERPHKAVLSGTSIDSATAVEFDGEGVALKPFAVVDVTGERDGGDLLISWVRRGRIGQELAGSGVEIPLSEESEAYEVDVIIAGSPEVVRTLTTSVQSVTYTAAQQATDFGSPTPEEITVRIYQLSASVGRGYPAEATL